MKLVVANNRLYVKDYPEYPVIKRSLEEFFDKTSSGNSYKIRSIEIGTKYENVFLKYGEQAIRTLTSILNQFPNPEKAVLEHKYGIALKAVTYTRRFLNKYGLETHYLPKDSMLIFVQSFKFAVRLFELVRTDEYFSTNDLVKSLDIKRDFGFKFDTTVKITGTANMNMLRIRNEERIPNMPDGEMDMNGDYYDGDDNNYNDDDEYRDDDDNQW